ncbi:MAG: toll/interleukin-1 receptor domain-containing protein [Verrucomicrobia bacterium]|nr:toll/interleukin-1 receptor domain-containing protein [Verrucomicrobiota bacterium]
MSPDFQYDAFLRHSAKDKAAVRPLAERLWADGLKVWFDVWVLKPGDRIPAKIEEGLEHSRVLVLGMSVNAFGLDWAQLESGTCGRGNLPFRGPLNQEPRLTLSLQPSAFILQPFPDGPSKGSLAQFPGVNRTRAVIHCS